MSPQSAISFAVLIPAYNEGAHIADVVRRVKRHAEHVVVVDDGSGDDTVARAEAAGAMVLKHGVNKGKGAAMETGFRYAREQRFEAVIALDADGQRESTPFPLPSRSLSRRHSIRA